VPEKRWPYMEIRAIPTELCAATRALIRHFFDIYKDLEPGKQTSVKGYEGREPAWFEIVASRQRVQRGET
jgi:inorganic pyrophosphatase